MQRVIKVMMRYNRFSPKLGVLYQLEPQFQLFANVSQSFEPPSHGELNLIVADALKAQRGTLGNSQWLEWG